MPLTSTKHPFRDVGPSLSPNGEYISFYSNRSGNWDIWIYTINARQSPKQLTFWESNELYPSWFSNGEKITFISDKNDNPDVWIMNLDGSDPQSIEECPYEEAWPICSPHGDWFYFISNRSGAFNVWAKNIHSGITKRITDYHSFSYGFPENSLFTKFAITSNKLYIPLETRSGEIYLLENF
jgi:Tol biopolymer transport system component